MVTFPDLTYRDGVPYVAPVSKWADNDGAFYKVSDLAKWRSRKNGGPYRVVGDDGANAYSPGSWTTMYAKALSIVANPLAEHYIGPTFWKSGNVGANLEFVTAYFPAFSYPEPTIEGQGLVITALVGRVLNDETMINAVITALTAQIAVPNLNFANLTLWEHGRIKDQNPLFIIGQWATRLIFAYDLIKNLITDTGLKTSIETWFYNMAKWMADDINVEINKYFSITNETNPIATARLNDTHTANSYVTSDTRNIYQQTTGVNILTHDGGHPIPRMGFIFNNRRWDIVRYVGYAGILFNDTYLKDSARVFFKEFIKYQVYPPGLGTDIAQGGMLTEAERNRDANFAEHMLTYMGQSMFCALDIAYIFHKNGDSTLRDYTTSAGMLNTVGGPKNIKMVVDRYGKFFDGTGTVTYTSTKDGVANTVELIDGVDISKAPDWFCHHDIPVMTLAYALWGENNYKLALRRQKPGNWVYNNNTANSANNPAGSGANPIYMGPGGAYPDILFMIAPD